MNEKRNGKPLDPAAMDKGEREKQERRRQEHEDQRRSDLDQVRREAAENVDNADHPNIEAAVREEKLAGIDPKKFAGAETWAINYALAIMHDAEIDEMFGKVDEMGGSEARESVKRVQAIAENSGIHDEFARIARDWLHKRIAALDEPDKLGRFHLAELLVLVEHAVGALVAALVSQGGSPAGRRMVASIISATVVNRVPMILDYHAGRESMARMLEGMRRAAPARENEPEPGEQGKGEDPKA